MPSSTQLAIVSEQWWRADTKKRYFGSPREGRAPSRPMQPNRAHGTSAPFRDLQSVSATKYFPVGRAPSPCRAHFATNASQFARTYGWHS